MSSKTRLTGLHSTVIVWISSQTLRCSWLQKMKFRHIACDVSSRSYKVIDFRENRKAVYDVILVINSRPTSGRNSHCFGTTTHVNAENRNFSIPYSYLTPSLEMFLYAYVDAAYLAENWMF